MLFVPKAGEVPGCLFELQRDGVPTAYVFLDPFARAKEKRGGAWMDEVGLIDR